MMLTYLPRSSFGVSIATICAVVCIGGCPGNGSNNSNENSENENSDNTINGNSANTNSSNENKNSTNGNDNGTALDTTYVGQATVLRATIGNNQNVLIDTGALPSSGGVRDATGLTVEIPAVLLAEIGHATTFGGNGISQSEAALANIDLVVGTHRVQADFLMARAVAQCSAIENGSASVRGELIASNLRIDGQITTTTAAPNQEISLRDGAGAVVGRVVLNEQVTTTSGVAGDIVVNGLRIEVPNIATVTLFSARAGISCGSEKQVDDFITGGGFFDGPNFGHAYFAVAGGLINSSFQGHFAYKDTGSGLRVIGTGVTAYAVIDGVTRHIEGTCEVDGTAGFTYAVDVTDNGEPGSADKFALVLSSGYRATGQLIGGNVKLHTATQ